MKPLIQRMHQTLWVQEPAGCVRTAGCAFTSLFLWTVVRHIWEFQWINVSATRTENAYVCGNQWKASCFLWQPGRLTINAVQFPDDVHRWEWTPTNSRFSLLIAHGFHCILAWVKWHHVCRELLLHKTVDITTSKKQRDKMWVYYNDWHNNTYDSITGNVTRKQLNGIG